MITYDPLIRLQMYLTYLGLPFVGIAPSWDANGVETLTVEPAPTATQAQINQMNQIASTWDMRVYRTSRIYDILTAIQALTTTQKTNISNDLFSGTPLKALLDDGANASAIFCLYYIVQTASMSGADKNLAKLYAAAMYCQDNPMYLITPPFDTSINVPGWSPIT